MFTRAMIQSFIDGFIAAGGNSTNISTAVQDYLSHNPTYQADSVESSTIMSDLDSYPVSTQQQLSPTLYAAANPPPP